MSKETLDDSGMVSINAVGTVPDTTTTSDKHETKDASSDINNDVQPRPELKSKVSTASISSSAAQEATPSTIATTTDSQTLAVDPAALPPKPSIVLLPPVEIEERPAKTVKEIKKPVSSLRAKTTAGVTSTTGARSLKPTTASTTATKTPLASSTGRAAGTSVAASTATGSASRLKPSTSSLTRTSTAVKTRPAIPASLKSTTAATTSSSSTTTPTARSTSSTLASRSTSSTLASRSSTATNTPSSTAASRTLTPSSSSSSLRKSPSTPSLSGSSTTEPVRNSTASGRRVASTSGLSPRSSPSSTPAATRSPSRASVVSSGTSPSTTTTTARRPIGTTTTTATTRKTPTSSTNPSPNSTLRQSSSTSSLSRTTRPTAASATSSTTPTPIRKTLAGSTLSTTATRSTPARPITDATKVKMLSTQLTGLQEKHDQTLRLLQEQEERLKKELEELSTVSDHERKPIPSDTQDVLQEMEELRAQFHRASSDHEKAIADLKADHERQLGEIKAAHEALLLSLATEKDLASEELKAVRESSELSDRERNEKIQELEEQVKTASQSLAEAVAKHAVAIQTSTSDLEALWVAKLDTRVQELSTEHTELLQAAEKRLQIAEETKVLEIQALRDEFAQQLKDLEDENESRVLALISKHESEIQEWRDKLSNETEAHEEALGEVQSKLDAAETSLKSRQESEAQARQDLDEQLGQVRKEMEQLQRMLAAKETETADLERRIQELTDDLENTSISAMLKNTKKHKVKLIQIYGSSVSGNLQIKRSQQAIADALDQLEIEHEFVDVASSDEAKSYMKRKNRGETALPQIFAGGEYRGTYDDFDYAIETHQLTQFLGFDRQRGFVPRHKLDHIEEGNAMAQHGEDAEQGAGRPDLVVNGLPNRTVGGNLNGKSHDTATSLYLLSPASQRFQSHNSLTSNSSSRSSSTSRRPGFVQTASQAWDSTLKEDVTRVKHDLGFHSNVVADEEELEELIEQGQVSEAELEAFLASQ
ncbi:hypothetical protein BGZ83_011586 [Gryganskiella cystojenkinii]|nr:hypothetical protein BGZ83_011586 [Gryganskiella cystojenkinii]